MVKAQHKVAKAVKALKAVLKRASIAKSELISAARDVKAAKNAMLYGDSKERREEAKEEYKKALKAHAEAKRLHNALVLKVKAARSAHALHRAEVRSIKHKLERQLQAEHQRANAMSWPAAKKALLAKAMAAAIKEAKCKETVEKTRKQARLNHEAMVKAQRAVHAARDKNDAMKAVADSEHKLAEAKCAQSEEELEKAKKEHRRAMKHFVEASEEVEDAVEAAKKATRKANKNAHSQSPKPTKSVYQMQAEQAKKNAKKRVTKNLKNLKKTKDLGQDLIDAEKELKDAMDESDNCEDDKVDCPSRRRRRARIARAQDILRAAKNALMAHLSSGQRSQTSPLEKALAAARYEEHCRAMAEAARKDAMAQAHALKMAQQAVEAARDKNAAIQAVAEAEKKLRAAKQAESEEAREKAEKAHERALHQLRQAQADVEESTAAAKQAAKLAAKTHKHVKFAAQIAEIEAEARRARRAKAAALVDEKIKALKAFADRKAAELKAKVAAAKAKAEHAAAVRAIKQEALKNPPTPAQHAAAVKDLKRVKAQASELAARVKAAQEACQAKKLAPLADKVEATSEVASGTKDRVAKLRSSMKALEVLVENSSGEERERVSKKLHKLRAQFKKAHEANEDAQEARLKAYNAHKAMFVRLQAGKTAQAQAHKALARAKIAGAAHHAMKVKGAILHAKVKAAHQALKQAIATLAAAKKHNVPHAFVQDLQSKVSAIKSRLAAAKTAHNKHKQATKRVAAAHKLAVTKAATAQAHLKIQKLQRFLGKTHPCAKGKNC